MGCIFLPKYTDNLRISQNFLTSSSLIKRIIKLSSLNCNDVVVEIGAGKGHLTKGLCEVCGKVIAIERDSSLYTKLSKNLSDIPNVQVLCYDFLKWDLPKTKFKVFANIPFSRTTGIVKKLLFSTNPPVEAWLVLEKGAAKRFLGTPNESLMSLLIKPLFDAEIIYHFSKSDFHPAPSVNTVLIHFHKKQTPDIEPGCYRRYCKFITDCMSSRSTGIRKYLTKKQIDTALKLAKLSTDITSGDILYIQWLCLFRCHMKFVK